MIKNTFYSLTLVIACLSLTSCHQISNIVTKTITFKKDKGKSSYATGYLIGNNIKRVENDLNIGSFLKGMEDALNEKKPLITQEQMREIQKQQFQSKMQNQKKQGAKQMEDGKKFLEENAKKENIKVTNSGLQYEVLKEGSGKQPVATNTVEVHYRGTLIDGTEFDSSYKRNQTISFPLNQVIKGWTEGVQLMKEGAKYKFYIPSELGYGANGAGAAIPPNATLIFEVELVKVL